MRIGWLVLFASCQKTGVPASAGSVAPAEERRVEDLEARVAALEARLDAVEQRPKAVDRAASPEASAAAAALLKQAQEAYVAMDVEGAKAMLATLRTDYGTTRAARAAQRLEEELAVVGRAEAPLEVDAWFQGSASDVQGGVATLLVFWEVWCPHCKREVPALSATYDRFRDRGLRMIGLTKQTRDVTDDNVRAFVEQEGVSYPIAREQGDALSRHYGVRGIPAAAMVKDGVVVWRGHPARLTDAMLDGFLR